MPLDSVLGGLKKHLNIDEGYTFWDPDLIMHANSVFLTLTQLGLGPTTGFRIYDDNGMWQDFTDNRADLEACRTYMYCRVRLLFDPPQMGYLVQALQDQIKEFEWRLNVQVEQPTYSEGSGPQNGM